MEKSFTERMKERVKSKIEFRDSLRINENYIGWLEEFTKKNSGFDTAILTYKKDEFSEEDIKNMEHIETFYEVISEFADKNYISSYQVDLGNYYSIKHNNTGFYIGVDYGQGVSFYCTRLEEVEDDALDYNDIIRNIKLPSTIQKEAKLEVLSRIMDDLLENDNISVDVIKNRVNDSFQKIKK